MALLNSVTYNDKSLNSYSLNAVSVSATLSSSAAVSATLTNTELITDLIATYRGVLNTVGLNTYALNKTTHDASVTAMAGRGSMYTAMVDSISAAATMNGASTISAPFVDTVSISATMNGTAAVGSVQTANTVNVSAGKSYSSGALNSLVLNSLPLNAGRLTLAAWPGSSMTAILSNTVIVSATLTGWATVASIRSNGNAVIRGGYNSYVYMGTPYSGAELDATQVLLTDEAGGPYVHVTLNAATQRISLKSTSLPLQLKSSTMIVRLNG